VTIAIYPGSFDPVTNGHLDITRRASRLFEKVIVGVYEKPTKNLLFTIKERVDLVRQSVVDLPNVEVQAFSGLVVDFAKQKKAQTLIRGLRMSADFEREFEMAMMNKKLYPALDLVCLMANQEFQFLSSSILKEVACLGGSIKCLVPECVAESLRKKVLEII